MEKIPRERERERECRPKTLKRPPMMPAFVLTRPPVLFSPRPKKERKEEYKREGVGEWQKANGHLNV